MSPHTPGPWTVGEVLAGGSLPIYQRGGPRMEVAKVNGRAGEMEANARLIAAAPELLARLKARVEDCGCCGDADFASDRACVDCLVDAALIAKAEGRS